jgi:hypothetical protein
MAMPTEKYVDKKNLVWPDPLTPSGKPTSSFANTRQALIYLRIELREDVTRKRVHLYRHMPEGNVVEYQVTDDAAHLLRSLIYNEFTFYPSRSIMVDVIHDVALRHGFNPIVDWLYSLKWDSKPRLDQLLTKYMGAEDTPLNRAIGRKLICAMVMRMQNPGIKFDYVLVLVGPQGVGKSLFCADLAGHPDYFTDSQIINRWSHHQVEAVEGNGSLNWLNFKA